jgi:hypothetical protein
MSGQNQDDFNREDLRILRHYAESGNRELYWNYLAQHPGNDGYGLLALGVVRNDNVPGQVANIYAQNYAKEHDGVSLDERGWQKFGVDLIRQDLAARERMMASGHPDRALNLPVSEVQRAHDVAFERSGIDPNAWTPRLLLESARRHGGQTEAEQMWDKMLDNGTFSLGIGRGLGTLGDAAYYGLIDDRFDGAAYAADVKQARQEAFFARANTNPNEIGEPMNYYKYDENKRTWSEEALGGVGVGGRPKVVTDPEKIAELNDARAVRLERQNMRDDFAPGDPNRNRAIMLSPKTFSENEQTPSVPGDPRSTDHPRHAMYRQIEDGVGHLGAQAGGVPAETNARMTMSCYALALTNGMNSVDHLMLNCKGTEHAAGSRVILVQGQDPSDPANRLAHMSTSEAASRPVEQSLQQAQTIEQQQIAVAQTQTQVQTQDAAQLGSPAAPVRTL